MKPAEITHSMGRRATILMPSLRRIVRIDSVRTVILLSTLIVSAERAQAAILISEDFEVPAGDIIGATLARTPAAPYNATAQALVNRGWVVSAGGTTLAGACSPYCTSAIVSMTGHTGALSNVLRFRYEEGPASDSAGSGLESTIGKECAFGAAFCFGKHQEIWERYYYMNRPVPANTPGCSPNCPTTSTYNNVATKQHYFRSVGVAGPSFVTDNFWGSNEMALATQDTPQSGGVGTAGTDHPNQGHVSFQDNVWYCVEVHIKYNTVGVANGVKEIYINGVPTVSYANQTIIDAAHASSGIDNFFFYRQSGGYQWRFEDDYVMSTTRVGCDGTPPPPPPVDTQAPSVPAGLSAQAASASQINLSWTASTDNVSVTGYRIYRGGSQIATAAGTSYSDTGLAASTAYTYTVAGYDAAGNVSAQSAAASAATQSGTTPAVTPGAVTNLSASAAGANSVNLSFTQVDDGTGQPAKYDIRYQSPAISWGTAASVAQGTCAVPLAGTQIGATKTCTVLGLSSSTDYQFQLVPFRGTMNAGAVFGPLSNVAGARTAAAQPAADIQPPAKPRNMRTQ